MADIIILNLDHGVISKLQERAAENHHSLEEEVHTILSDAFSDERTTAPRDIAKFAQECFGPLGGVELEVPARAPMRDPPDFD